MGKIVQIFLSLVVCLGSAKSLGEMRSEEELAALNKKYQDFQQTLNDVPKNLDGEALSKYRPLRKALDTYANFHGKEEGSFSGSGWADGVAAAEESVQKEFIELFRKLDSGQLTEQSELEWKQKDIELNRIYQKIQNNKNLDSEVAASISRHGVKETQRKWIKYRDAWLAFAKVKFPTVSKYSLSATLTADRISRLKEIPEEQ